MNTLAPPKIDFDPVAHKYRLDGAAVPGVSEILDHAYDFRFVDPDAMERARDLGKKVHKTIELFEDGVLDRATLHPSLDNHLKQWERFKDDFLFLPIAHELIVGSRKHKFCGTLDCHGLLLPRVDGDEEEPLLLDVKTGEEYAPHKLQTAAYKIAAVEQGILPASTKRASLYLDEEGYAIRWHKGPMDEVAFISLSTFRHWELHYGKK